ncbi:MAG: PEP-CTERM system histidine kinase PrsK [Acidiphilium sp.]|nr:PEP-CTERM system histidine kinase PrsK [Acidiphilium sp.]MDD4935314.1 PEP-CTERM system histidine kinase PrsK [Acidiphilium sp.]
MTLTALIYAGAGISYTALGVGLTLRRHAQPMAMAAFLTVLWAVSMIAAPNLQTAAWFIQASGWIGAIGALERRFSTAPNAKVRLATRIMIGCGIAVAAVAVLSTTAIWLQADGLVIEARLFFALITLILIENVYRNADDDIRWHINLPLIAIATMALFTFLLYGDAIIHRHLSPYLLQAQAVVYLIVLPLFAGTEYRMRRWRNLVTISHSAAFYTTSLILGGSFLVGLGITGTLFQRYGKDWGSVFEIALIFSGIVLISVLASSGSARSKLRQIIADNFFAQRYDYRREWLRCIETLAAIEQGGLPQRVIKVLADTIDSPSGVLMLRDGTSETLLLNNAGEWNMRGPAAPLDNAHPLMIHLCREVYCRLDGAYASIAIDTTPACWLALALPDPRSPVPLGVVLLGAPRAGTTLNEESVALLRVVAREISLMLAERRAAEALAEARRFAAAGQRFAFVAHDIKNVANQLALLISNADHHMNDPDFRDDMMATLRGSVGKIQSMLTRLKSPEIPPPVRLPVVDRLRALNACAAWSKGAVGVVLDVADPASDIAMEAAAFDAVMNHLIDNAIDASAPGQIVSVQVEREVDMVAITITDRGIGMSDTFIRDQLFRPFISSKASGFGLGAFQARELVHAAGGTVVISSTPKVGTVVKLRFPTLDPISHTAKLVIA